MAQYYTLITNKGLEKEAQSHTTETENLQLTTIALGDGNGFMYDPDGDETKLKNEVFRTNINRVYLDPKNKSQLIIEGIIPSSAGGFTIREVGIFDRDGDLFAIGKYPQTNKPVISDGAGKDLYIRMVLKFSNSPNVNLIIDPSVMMVSIATVNDIISDGLLNHELGKDAHYGAFQGLQEIGSNAPVGIHNQYFLGDIEDYGTLTADKPFRAENVPMTRCDLARGGYNYDYGELK